jgi:opacity protein-like surface antigen
MAGSIGYRFAPHFRAELQSGYYNSNLDAVHAPGAAVNGLSAARPGEPYGLCAKTSTPPGCLAPRGWTFMWTGMANLIYDTLPDSRFDPFVGAGVGLTHVQWAAHSRTDLFSGVPGPISVNNPATQFFKNAGTLNRLSQFSVQALAGVSYRISPRFHLDLTYYHYLTAGMFRWNPVNSTPGLPVGAGLRTGDFLGRFQDDSAIVSVRYAF